MRRFEFKDQKSDKFWEIDQQGPELTTRWGRCGTSGQSKTKEFADASAAAAALQKQIEEKTNKGYQEVGTAAGAALKPATGGPPPEKKPQAAQAVAPSAAPVEAAGEGAVETLPAPASPAAVIPPSPHPSPAPSSAQGSEAPGPAPWLIDQPAWAMPQGSPGISYLPSRLYPAPPPFQPKMSSLAEGLTSFASLFPFDPEASSARFRPAIEEAVRLLKNPSEIHKAGETALGVLICGLESTPGSRAPMGDLLAHLFYEAGRPKLLRAFLAAEQMEIRLNYQRTQNTLTVLEAGDKPLADPHSFEKFLSGGEKKLRAILSSADDEEWSACEEIVLNSLDKLPPVRQPIMALVMPESREISDRAAENLLALAQIPFTVKALILTATSGDLIKGVEKAKIFFPDGYGASSAAFTEDVTLCGTILVNDWAKALELLLPKAEYGFLGWLLAHINSPRAVEALALVSQKGGKWGLGNAKKAFENWPCASIIALGRLLSDNRRDMAFLRPAFLNLCAEHPAAFELAATCFDQSTLAGIKELLKGHENMPLADREQLPEILVSPPWTRKKARPKAAQFKLDPLSLPPLFVWDEKDRNRVLTPDNDYMKRELEKAAQNPRWVFSSMGLERGDNNEQAKKYMERALAAVKNNKPDELLAVFEAFFQKIEEMRQKDKWYWFGSLDCAMLTQLPEEMAVTLFNNLATRSDAIYNLEYIVARFGLDILPGLLAVIKRWPTEAMPMAAHFGLVELAPIMARAFYKLKTMRELGQGWLLNFPEQAVCGLIAPAFGPKGEGRSCAAAALRFLNSHGHHDLIMAKARLYPEPDLPAALENTLNENELDLYPAKIPGLPVWWQPAAWRPPVVAEGPQKGKALPPEALGHIAAMLAFPDGEGWYAGLETVKAFCTGESLAAWAWDVFNTWLSSGAPPKDRWAFTALGLFGSDETARKLTVYIREWPGLGAHGRAVAGLDILAAIGSDVALMQLNGIAQKIKFKGLQDKAREKIQDIAEKMGLSPEELDDRLAPDFGLDEQGTLTLDFGPRQFVVGFDEALKPYVKDPSGKRLANLPKPGKSDDQTLASEAAERFKGLKKDVRTVAAQQIFRLEQAMCSRRRWNRENFQAFLVEHPLMRHLVQRLVWAAYRLEPDGEGQIGNYGGTPDIFFRVSEDNSFTDAADNPLVLPEAENVRLGLPHILETPPTVQTEFGQLFADYELIQPFAQLGRETYALKEEEKDLVKFNRWAEIEINTGQIFGLSHRGWRRGSPQDGGWVGWMYKNLGPDLWVLLYLDPGFAIGYTEMSEPQTVADLEFGAMVGWENIEKPLALKEIDSIIISELIREMEILTRKAD